MRHRPTEIKAVIKLLDQEHADVETLAQAVLDLLVEIKWGNAPWIAIQRHSWDGDAFTAWGPYATRYEAERDLGKRIIGKPGSPCKNSCGQGPQCERCTRTREYAYFCKVWNKDATDKGGDVPWVND